MYIGIALEPGSAIGLHSIHNFVAGIRLDHRRRKTDEVRRPEPS